MRLREEFLQREEHEERQGYASAWNAVDGVASIPVSLKHKIYGEMGAKNINLGMHQMVQGLLCSLFS